MPVSSDYMVSVEDTRASEHEGETRPRRHPQIGDGELLGQYEEGVTTMYESFQLSVKKYGEHDFMGTRKIVDGTAQAYQFESYGTVGRRVQNLASGLATLGLGEKANVGLYSVNRAEWIIGEQACYANNYVTVPLYDTLGDEALEFICQQTEMQAVIIDVKKVPVILKLKDRIPGLKKLIIMDEEPTPGLIEDAKKVGLEVLLLAELEQLGKEKQDEWVPRPPAPNDLCTICYTSGTTGRPKGAMISHKTLVAALASALFLLGHNNVLSNPNPVAPLEATNEVYLSFLPLAHIFERVVFNTLAVIGTKIGFYQGDVTKLLDDVETLKPTFFVSVPRLFNRVHDKVMAGVEAKGGITKWLFNHALQCKLAAYRKTGALSHWLWDRLVFGGIKAKLGGRVKVMLTGAAPLSPAVLDFLRVVFTCEVFEGYGMTESCAITAVTHKGDNTDSQVGGPVPSVEIKLVDIPEMGYTSKDEPFPRGEVWIRGPTVFSGYYKNKEQTAGAMVGDWLITGDVGMFDKQGRLFIIDRKKALFKLAQGEYISPEKIEAILARSPFIAQAYIEGNSLKSSVVAVIIPDPEIVIPWAQSKGIEGDFKAICADPRTKEAITAEIKKMGSNGSGELKGFELPRAIHLDDEAFGLENDLLTPTFKMKRPQVKAKYESIVSKMYASIPN